MNNNETENSCVMVCVKKAAATLGVSPRTIWRMIADKQLTAVRFRRCPRLSLAQVLRCLNGNGKAGGV